MKTIEKLTGLNGIVALVELNNDCNLTEASLEVLTAAKTMNVNAKVVILTSQLTEHTRQQIAESGLSHVITVDIGNYQVEKYTEAMSQIVKQFKPQLIIAPDSSNTRDFLPRVAARHQAGYTPDCMTFESMTTFTRPLYSGKILCKISGALETMQIVLLRAKAFRKAITTPSILNIEAFTVDLKSITPRTETVSVASKDTNSQVSLVEADVVVSGGRGLKGPENFHLVESLAKKLNAAVGATRAVVDAGWRPHSEQVGQTGKNVSPQLYIALGIHGAIQHLVGMNTSQNIIAINTNPDAPIFEVADLCIIGDVFEIVPALLEKL